MIAMRCRDLGIPGGAAQPLERLSVSGENVDGSERIVVQRARSARMVSKMWAVTAGDGDGRLVEEHTDPRRRYKRASRG